MKSFLIIVFLIIYILSFAFIMGWQNQKIQLGGEPRRGLTIIIYAIILTIFVLVARWFNR